MSTDISYESEARNISGKKTIEKVKISAEYVLLKGSFTSEDSCISGNQIRNTADEIFGDQTSAIPDNTYYQYLSVLASNSESLISRPVGRKGYFFQESESGTAPSDLDAPDDTNRVIEEAGGNATRIQREALLYPLVEGWLKVKNLQAGDVSTQKKNERWGNPDVLGLRIEQAFDTYAVEIVSVEVKSSDQNWRQYFFEAVSHRRFANRSYFCFAEKRSKQLKIEEEMRYYSDLFQVGVLVIYLPDETFDALLNSANIEELDISDFDIVEQLTAKNQYVAPTHQYTFLKNLNLDTIPKLAVFGNGN